MDKEKTEARKEAKQEVKMYISNDWELVEETPEFFLLKKNTQTFGGHLLVFFLTFWFTLGLGNLVYFLACRKKKKILNY